MRTVQLLVTALTAISLAGCAAESTELPAQEEGDEVGRAARATEQLAVNVSESRDRGWRGKRYDFSYPVGGRAILRHEFQVKTRGSANAEITSIDSKEIKVHAWADAFSGFTFDLKVWTE